MLRWIANQQRKERGTLGHIGSRLAISHGAIYRHMTVDGLLAASVKRVEAFPCHAINTKRRRAGARAECQGAAVNVYFDP